MDIKQIKGELRHISLKEWNDTVEAYVKPLEGIESFVLFDLYLTFYRKTEKTLDRFNAGFDAAQIALVNKDGEPLLTEQDRTAVRGASIVPITRLFSTLLEIWSNQTEEPEGLKKN